MLACAQSTLEEQAGAITRAQGQIEAQSGVANNRMGQMETLLVNRFRLQMALSILAILFSIIGIVLAAR